MLNDELDTLIGELEASLAAVFLAAILVWRTSIDYALLITALRARDIDAAIYALHLERGAFSGYALERQSAFAKVGVVEAKTLTEDRAAFYRKRGDAPLPGLPGSPLPVARGLIYEPPRTPARVAPVTQPLAQPVAGPAVPPRTPPTGPTLSAPGGGRIEFIFDAVNPRAEAKIRTEAGTRITGYVDEQIETARRVIADGFQRGEGPQTIATDIAGRINPISGRREGGIVGLSSPQVDYVDNMRRRLLSSDPDEMMKVLGRFNKDGKWIEGTGMTLRDRRFDGAIKKAIRDVAAGKENPLTGDKIDEMAAKYSDRLLRRRAEDISRTETASGVEMARAEATKQAMEREGLPDDAVEKEWVHSGGVRDARDTHLAANGMTVTGVDTPFILADGSVMLYPHDPAGGPRNNISCACTGQHNVIWDFLL